VYDHDLDEVTDLGWEEFVIRQWESIFVGYRSWTGLRTIGRRWSDLIEVGLGCSQDVADWLVKTHVIHGPDLGLQSARDGVRVVSGMVELLAGLRPDLAGLQPDRPDRPGRPGLAEMEPRPAEFWLLDRHARLLGLIRTHAFGQDDGEPLQA
jgi:hypothetical protein